MIRRKKIINQCISILMLFIYLFGSSSILSSHNHDDDHHHHHHHFSTCENFDSNSFNPSDCSHDSHITSSEESCPLCDHFSNCKPAILERVINTVSESFTVKEVQLFTSLYLIDANNTQNKSPPFII